MREQISGDLSTAEVWHLHNFASDRVVNVKRIPLLIPVESFAFLTELIIFVFI